MNLSLQAHCSRLGDGSSSGPLDFCNIKVGESMAFEKELSFMREIAVRAGEVGLRYQKMGFRAETKSDNSPVTAADRESEAFICAALIDAFPDDGILGEEG